MEAVEDETLADRIGRGAIPVEEPIPLSFFYKRRIRPTKPWN